ncbi:hypothetical protein OH77DRAFT_1410926 [Trametes cingulata]|nr:hypothetical protein OH77DRAFT_1410926 [Trametes cingulata]
MDTARNALDSYAFCEWPLLSLLPSCPRSLAGTPSPIRAVDFPGLISLQHRVLDEFLGQSSTGTEFALNIKHAELAVQDLIGMVKGSNLTLKEELSEALTDFVLDARHAARGLQRFSAKVQGTVDSISAFNAYTLREIGAARGKGARAALDAVVVRTFRASMSSFAAHISRLLVEASITSADLDRLEERLAGVHSLSVQETFITAAAEDELLWSLWTWLGGNKAQLRDLANRSTVLKEVQQYRSIAAAYIAGAMQTLMAVEADLAELQERITTSGGEVADIPLEVTIAAIERALGRLKEGRFKSPGNADRDHGGEHQSIAVAAHAE